MTFRFSVPAFFILFGVFTSAYAQTAPNQRGENNVQSVSETHSMSSNVNSAGGTVNAGQNLLTLPRSAADQNLRNSLEYCGGVSINAERLVCYEKAASEAQIKTWNADTGADINSIWGFKYRGDAGSETYAEAKDVNGATKNTLFIRCSHGKMQLFERWALPIGTTPIHMRLSFDHRSETGEELIFTPSVSGASLGLWDDDQAKALAKELTNHKSGFADFIAYFPDGPDESSYNLEGLAQALRGVRRSCGW